MQQRLAPDFSATQALRYALDKFNENAGYCCGFLGLIELVCLAASAVLSFHCVLAAQLLFQLDSPPPESYLLAFVIIYLCLRCPCQLLINRWFLLLLDGQHVSYDELLSFNFLAQVPLVLRLAAASIICSCYTLLGTILLVFPGIFAASTLRFYKFLIIDRDADAVQALRQSYEICGEHKGQLVGLSLLSMAVKLGGLCLLGIGWIPASAVCGLAEAYAYKKLSEEPASEAPAQRAYLN